jgi:hypothetical protein
VLTLNDGLRMKIQRKVLISTFCNGPCLNGVTPISAIIFTPWSVTSLMDAPQPIITSVLRHNEYICFSSTSHSHIWKYILAFSQVHVLSQYCNYAGKFGYLFYGPRFTLVITPLPVPAPVLPPSTESDIKKAEINSTSTVAAAPETTTTSSETTTPIAPTTPTTPPLPEYLDPELLSLKASGPDTFCQRFISGGKSDFAVVHLPVTSL